MSLAWEAQSGTQERADAEKPQGVSRPVFGLAGGVTLGCLAFSLLPLPVLPVLGLGVLGLIFAWRLGRARWLALGVLLACLAGTAQLLRGASISPTLAGQQAGLATLSAIKPAGERQRLTLAIDTRDGPVPLRLTYTAPAGDAPLAVGALYQVVFWAAPARPVAYPGAYDSAYALQFQGIAGVGAARKLVQIAPAPALGVDWGWLRRAIDARVRDVLPGPEGGVASALMTGYRANIDGQTRALFRSSGLAHLLAISGLHRSLVAGAIFTLARLGFWLRPSLMERTNPQRVATLLALGGALCYFLLSGASIPTQRALILLALASMGLLFGRTALSWRLWALALTAVLLVNPSAVFSISTHLSFLAVAVLIRAGQWVQDWRAARRDVGAVRAWAVGLLGTSVAVNFLTIPLLLLTFGRAPLYGVLANLVAVPLAGVALIPLALISLAAMPLGLDAYPLMALGRVIEFLIWLARWVTDLPGNTLVWAKLPYPPLWVLLAGYALFLAPKGVGPGPVQRFQRALGWGLIALCLGLPLLLPSPTRLEHAEGWVLEKGLGDRLVNTGQAKISAYAFDQAKALWASDQFPDEATLSPRGTRASGATQAQGSLVIYTLAGREWGLSGNLVQRRTKLRWLP